MPKRRTTSSERYKRLIRQRRIFVLSVFILVVILCVCLFTPLFGITEITVRGNTVLTTEEVIQTSGIEKGENVFRISKSRARKALKKLAYAEDAQIKRKFPARIEIVLDEATPDIILDTPENFVVTNIGGRVLEVTDDVTHLSAPIVYGIEVEKAEPAQQVEAKDAEKLETTIMQISCFFDTTYWADIDEFYVSDPSNFMMVMKSGMKVTFGTIESIEKLQRKIKMLSAILPQVKQTENSYLDLATDKGYFGEYTKAELEEMRRQEEKDEEKDTENGSEDKDKPEEETDSRKKASAEAKKEEEKESSEQEAPSEE